MFRFRRGVLGAVIPAFVLVFALVWIDSGASVLAAAGRPAAAPARGSARAENARAGEARAQAAGIRADSVTPGAVSGARGAGSDSAALEAGDSAFGGAVVKTAGPDSAPGAVGAGGIRPLPRISLDLQNIELRELVRILGKQAGVTVYADPAVSGLSSLHVVNLPFEDALRVMLQPRGLAFSRMTAARDTSSVQYHVYDPASSRRLFVVVRDGRLYMDVQRFALPEVVAEIARESGRSLVMIGNPGQSLTLTLQGIPFDDGLAEIARAASSYVVKDGVGDDALYRIISSNGIGGAASLASAASETSALGGGPATSYPVATGSMRILPGLVPVPVAPFEVVRLGSLDALRIRASDAALSSVLLEIGRVGALSIVLGEDVVGRATVYFDSIAPEDAVRALASRGGLEVRVEKGSLVVSRPSTDPIQLRVEDGLAELHVTAAPVRDVIERVARAESLPQLAFDPALSGNISIHLARVPVDQLLEHVLAAKGLRVEPVGNLMMVVEPSREKRMLIGQTGGLVSVDLQNAPLNEVVREFSSRTSVNISIPRGDTQISLSLKSVPLATALSAIGELVGLAVVEEAERYRFVPPDQEPTGVAKAEVSNRGLLTLEVKSADLAHVARVLEDASGRNILVETGATGTISGRISGVPFELGLRTFLSSKGYRLRKTGGIYRIAGAGAAAGQPDAAPNYEIALESGRLTVDVTDADLSALLRQIADEAGLNLALYGSVKERVNLVLRGEALETALAKIMAGTKYGYELKDSMLVVGDISQAGSPMAAMAMRGEVIPIRYLAAKEMPALLPAEIPAGQVKVLEAQNALLVTGRPELIARARTFISGLDRKPSQIQIEALLVEYRTTKAFTYNLSSLAITGIAPNVATVAPSQGSLSFTVTDLKNFNDPQFQAGLTALVERGEAAIRARPSMATITGKEAKINVQSQENFRVTQPSSTQGVPLVQIQTITSGITLRITPYVSTDADAVTLDLFIEDSSAGDRTADGLPSIATRNAQNRMVLRNDRTAVIGGLIRSDTAKSGGGFPILSELPIIGGLFGRRSNTNRQSTLVFYITPRVIMSDTTVAEAFMRQGAQVDSDALRPSEVTIILPGETTLPKNAI